MGLEDVHSCGASMCPLKFHPHGFMLFKVGVQLTVRFRPLNIWGVIRGCSVEVGATVTFSMNHCPTRSLPPIVVSPGSQDLV